MSKSSRAAFGTYSTKPIKKAVQAPVITQAVSAPAPLAPLEAKEELKSEPKPVVIESRRSSKFLRSWKIQSHRLLFQDGIKHIIKFWMSSHHLSFDNLRIDCRGSIMTSWMMITKRFMKSLSDRLSATTRKENEANWLALLEEHKQKPKKQHHLTKVMRLTKNKLNNGAYNFCFSVLFSALFTRSSCGLQWPCR